MFHKLLSTVSSPSFSRTGRCTWRSSLRHCLPIRRADLLQISDIPPTGDRLLRDFLSQVDAGLSLQIRNHGWTSVLARISDLDYDCHLCTGCQLCIRSQPQYQYRHSKMHIAHGTDQRRCRKPANIFEGIRFFGVIQHVPAKNLSATRGSKFNPAYNYVPLAVYQRRRVG
ncbi:hypothetical protein B0H13DRAFT_2267684 [Mycena leptocephala]|nr:hypothetical protein B0H13DRAFT_2267684 [Mycena leptocephala]